MELNQWQLHYPFAEQASQINGFVLKEKKKHILLDSVETNLNIWRVQWPSPRQVRVQIPTSPRQVRDDRNMSWVRTRVLQPLLGPFLFSKYILLIGIDQFCKKWYRCIPSLYNCLDFSIIIYSFLCNNNNNIFSIMEISLCLLILLISVWTINCIFHI